MCEICRCTPCMPGCPNYEPPKTNKKCSFCGDYICIGEEYVTNYEGEYAHLDCLDCSSSDMEWLGIKIEIGDKE